RTGDGRHLAVVTLQRLALLALRHVEEGDLAVLTAGDHRLAVRREGDAEDRRPRDGQLAGLLARGDVPEGDPAAAVVTPLDAARRQQLAVRREGDAAGIVQVTLQAGALLAGGGVPEADQARRRRRGEVLAVLAERYPGHAGRHEVGVLPRRHVADA